MDFIAQLKQLRSQVGNVEGLDTTVLTQFDQAITQAELYQGIDPQAARTAIQQLEQRQTQDNQLQTVAGERDQLQTTVGDLQGQLTDSRKQFTALKGLSAAGIRPEYEELLLPQVTSGLELAENGEIKTPDGLYDGFKQKYPAMFFAEDGAGTGGAAGDGNGSTEETQQVTANGGVVSGVNPDDVLSGKVKVSMG